MKLSLVSSDHIGDKEHRDMSIETIYLLVGRSTLAYTDVINFVLTRTYIDRVKSLYY